MSPDEPTPIVGQTAAPLIKAPTGIRGFDEITHGGLPRGRATLVTGGAGSGKTLFALEFLARGALDFGEPGVLMSFEESSAELATNVESLWFDLPTLERDGLLVVDAFQIDAATIVQTGSFDLEGLFIRLALAVDEIGAKRVVLDTVEVLFTALGNESIVRAELTRLLRWLKERGLTVVITGERGRAGSLTRFGIEEYVSDCVVVLDHRVTDEMSTRRLRIAKYRGSLHGTNEYPFLLTSRGVTVLPLTSMGLSYPAPTERMSIGIERLDHMLGGGIYRGSTVLVSGSPGTGKTSLGAHMADAACSRGERVLFMSFEESPEQLLRNMGSIGLDLRRWVDAGLLRLLTIRPTTQGLEEHLVQLQEVLDDCDPSVAVLDAVGGLSNVASLRSVTSAVARQIDMLKDRGITAMITALTYEDVGESSALAVSSLVDTWLLLRNTELNGERNRLLFVMKNRGSAHSNQVREFLLTDFGAELLDVYVGARGVLTGSARMAQLAEEGATNDAWRSEMERRRQAVTRREAQVERQIAGLRDELAAEVAEVDQLAREYAMSAAGREADRAAMATYRWADSKAAPSENPRA